MTLEYWHRPWAWLAKPGLRNAEAVPRCPPVRTEGPGWLCVKEVRTLLIDGRPPVVHPEFRLRDGRAVLSLPLPLRHGRPMQVTSGGKSLDLDWQALPERPTETPDLADPAAQRQSRLMQRVQAIWARIREVEETLDNPATIWERLEQIWLEGSEARPEMDVIVRHAQALPGVLDQLDLAPRRTLRRTSQLLPLGRAQELDRRAMLWLARQPGDTMAERAGDRQRILAVAREENFNTLENRVVLSYARLAAEVAWDYAQRHQRAKGSGRVRRVHHYSRRCRDLARTFQERGVVPAGADARPNYVLQNNWQYQQVWQAWHELLDRRRALDELWRWQARSWEEFCALAVIIAARSIPGARSVALSPITFRAEQSQGCWIDHVNPVAVFFFEQAGVVMEITYRAPLLAASARAAFGAPIWLRVGRLGSQAIQSRWAIWPLWSADGGLETDEGQEIAGVVASGRREGVMGGLTLRPERPGEEIRAEMHDHGRVACLTLGTAGPGLKAGITHLREALMRHVIEVTL